MNILILGSGGREHALAWKLRQSPKNPHIFVAPGNAGTALVATNLPLVTKSEIIEWVQKNPPDLVVVGPDSYLAEGIVDDLEGLNISVFGPTQLAAEIEWSKAFAKQLMKEEKIPTAAYQTFTDIGSAKKYLEKQLFPVVIKASGLAFGKGVAIAKNREEAERALEEMMWDGVFGEAGKEVVIEEYLRGKEISVHAFCDGEHAVLFPPSQDHKRIFENDEGPNTGGMGTIAPVPSVTEREMQDIQDQIVLPILRSLKKRGRLFKGILFPGIMITTEGPKVIEFNARFGDPETQSYMRILESDLVDILFACVQGNVNEQEIVWSQKSACCVVCVSGGYPGTHEKGKEIHGLEKVDGEDVIVFHAGTKRDEGLLVTNGGRVLGITCVGNTLAEALGKAYAGVGKVSFGGMRYRKDIGAKEL